MDTRAIDRPEGIPERFVEAWNERDADAIAELFDEDAEFVNVTGIWWHDREAIRRAHAYGLRRIFDRSTLHLGTVRVKHLSESIAVVHARMTLTGQTPRDDVGRPGTRRNIFSFVVHRTDRGWSCASAHNTDVVPGETNVVDAEGRIRPADYRELGGPCFGHAPTSGAVRKVESKKKPPSSTGVIWWSRGDSNP